MGKFQAGVLAEEGGPGQGPPATVRDACSCDGLMVGEGHRNRGHTPRQRECTQTQCGDRGGGRKVWARLFGDSGKKPD